MRDQIINFLRDNKVLSPDMIDYGVDHPKGEVSLVSLIEEFTHKYILETYAFTIKKGSGVLPLTVLALLVPDIRKRKGGPK